MLRDHWTAAQRWARHHLSRIPYLNIAPSKDQRRNLQESGFSEATLPAPQRRRSAPSVALPLWAALLLYVLAAALVIASLVIGATRIVQQRQSARMAAIQAIDTSATVNIVPTTTPIPASASQSFSQGLSDSWSNGVLQWQAEIEATAADFQLDPNLLAAIMEAESGGDPNGVSYAGAVGLMGIMPRGSGAGLNNRPSARALADPATNIEWGAQIFAGYFEEAEGNLHLALAVYNGGWLYAYASGPQSYASAILDSYARAVVERANVQVDAGAWTVALKRENHISAEPLVSDADLHSGWPLYAKHTFLDGDQPIIAYAVPLERE